MLKIGENGLLPSIVHTWGWACVCRVDLTYVGCELEETLTTQLKYKSSCLSPKPSPTYLQPRDPLFEVLHWQNTLHSMSWLGLGGLVQISSIPSPSMAFLVSFHTNKLGWISLFFVLLPIIVSLISMFFASIE